MTNRSEGGERALPLNWNWHSCDPRMCPAASATTASGDSVHNCRCTDDKPGMRPHRMCAEKLPTTLQKKEKGYLEIMFYYRKTTKHINIF